MLTATLSTRLAIHRPALTAYRHGARTRTAVTPDDRLTVHVTDDPAPGEAARVLRVRPAETPVHWLTLRYAPAHLRDDVYATAQALSAAAFPDAWIVTPAHLQHQADLASDQLDDFLCDDPAAQDLPAAERYAHACTLGYGGMDPAYLQRALVDHRNVPPLTAHRAAQIPDPRLRRLAQLALALPRHAPPLPGVHDDLQLSLMGWAHPTAILDPGTSAAETEQLDTVINEAYQMWMEDDENEQYALELGDTPHGRRVLRAWKASRGTRFRHAERLAGALAAYLDAHAPDHEGRP